VCRVALYLLFVWTLQPVTPIFYNIKSSLAICFLKRSSLAFAKKNASNDKNSQRLQAPCGARPRGVAGAWRTDVWRVYRIRTFFGLVANQTAAMPTSKHSGRQARNLI